MSQRKREGIVNIRSLLIVALVFVVAMGAGLWMLEGTTVHRVRIAAGSKSGESYAVARAIAAVVGAHHPNVHVQVVETLGSEQNIELLEGGRVELATVQGDTETGITARLIASLYLDAYQLLAREDSKVRTPADLVGHSIALPPKGSGQSTSFWFLASHYGLAKEDFRAVPMSGASADWALVDGTVDAVFGVRAPGNARLLRLIESVPCRLLPIEQAAAMRLKQPALSEANLPSGSYRGSPPMPARDLPTVGVARLLIAHADLDPQVGSIITSVLFERRRELVSRTPLAGFISAPNRASGTLIPLHPGAESYYDRDEPSFFQENAEPIAVVLSLGALLVSAILQLASRRRRRRVDQYNRLLLRLVLEVRKAEDLAALRKHKERLIQIAGQVVDAAEAGDISPDGFSFFTFTWELAQGVVAEREKEILAGDGQRPDRG